MGMGLIEFAPACCRTVLELLPQWATGHSPQVGPEVEAQSSPAQSGAGSEFLPRSRHRLGRGLK